ncbi:ABC transporter substrate-binding protein [Candidatus Poriferisocius sp.]|uniref:ABC transporter substrate-binding protein n=1 Tax=Candidatus Poriferisocius sp. TaxID=3101276 RepID=UPI003B010496
MRIPVLGVLVAALALLAPACKTPDLQGPVVRSPVTPTATATPAAVPTVVPGPTAVPVTPGISDKVIRVGVIADTSTGNVVSDGSESAWLAMRAWAQSVNDSGGVGGRNVEVVLINANVFDHRAAIQEACRSDIFALVGSYARFDGDGVDILNEESCRLPDFPAAALSPARRESPVTFVSNPTANNLGQAGPARYLSERFPDAATAVATVVLDLPVAFYRAEREIEAATKAGFEFSFRTTVDLNEDYAAIAAALEEADVRAISWSAGGRRLLELLQARAKPVDPPLSPPAEAGGATPAGQPGPEPPEGDEELDAELAFVHCSLDCYSRGWAEDVGELGSNVWVSIGMLPFEEPGESAALVEYLFYLTQVGPDANPEAGKDLIGLSSWASALLFERAVNQAMFTSGGGLTRDLVIEAAGTITEWDGNGLHGPTNPAEGIPSPCFVLMSPTPGGWVRRHPLAQGTMDCEAGNLVELTTSATLGVSPSRPDPAESSKPGAASG